MAEEKNISNEVREALTTPQDQIVLETLGEEDQSPLNSPVVEKDIGGEKQILEKDQDTDSESWNVWKPKGDGIVSELSDEENETDYRKAAEVEIETDAAQEPLDAPEQEINDGKYIDGEETITDKDFQVPLAQANQVATALLGMTNNVLTATGGYFVKIRKYEEFYEFSEIIDVIDAQNQKNVNRIILDKEDKALLRPLLAEVIRKKSKQLTPEQQLMGAVASILLKKGQTVMEIRAENTLLENRLINIIKDQQEESETTIYDDDSETNDVVVQTNGETDENIENEETVKETIREA